MSLYIRDAAVDGLARQVQRALKAPTKTEAVRVALQNELDRANRSVPLPDRIRRYQDAMRALGPNAPEFDLKKFMDDGWNGV